MLLNCLKKLGKGISATERAELEAAFNEHVTKGLSEYDAGMAALSGYHRGLFDSVNELRVAAKLQPVEYKLPTLPPVAEAAQTPKPEGIESYGPQSKTESPVAQERAAVESAESATNVATRTPDTNNASRDTNVGTGTTTSPATESKAEPARFYHRDYGEVSESPSQRRVGKGRVRVVAEDGSEHVIKRSAMTGAGNERAVPIRKPTSEPAANIESYLRPKSAEVMPVPKGFTRFYHADVAKGDHPLGGGWARDPEYVSTKYGAGTGDETTRETIWYTDVPNKTLESEYGDAQAVSTLRDPEQLGATEPKLYRRKEGNDIAQVATPLPESTTAAKKSAMAQDRAALDLPELPQAERKSWAKSLDEAKDKQIDRRALLLADEVLTKPRGLSDEESAGVVLRAQQVKNEHAAKMREIGKATDTGTINARRNEAEALEREFDKLTRAVKLSGTQNARALAAQKLTINQDYDLVSLVQRAKAAKGRELTTDEHARYEQQATRISELGSQLADAQVKAEQRTLDNEIRKVSRQRQRSETRATLDSEYAQLRAEFAQARAEARGVQPSGLAGLDPEGKLTPLIARMAKNRIKAGINSTEALVRELYETVKDHGWSRDDVLGVIRSTIRESDDVLSRWDKTRQAQLVKQQAEFQRRLSEHDYSKPPTREKPIYNRETLRLEEEIQHLKNRFNLELERAKPGHWLRQLSGLRKSWMLTGLSTQAKNIGGTGAYQVFDEVARLPAVIADAAVAPFTGRRSITGPSPTAMLDSVLHAIKVGGREAGQILRTGATREQLERHQFSEIDTGVKVIDAASNAVFRFMSASDRVFYQQAYRRNLLDRALAQAKTESKGRERAKELADSPSKELDAAAKHDALVTTFNNNNKLSDAIKSARGRLGPSANFAIDLVMPFDRTPTNVVARIVEASPAGFGKSAYRLARATINKSMTAEEQRQFAQTLGRATVGTALMGLGWTLADKLFDIDDYQVFFKLGSLRINLNSIFPVGNLLALGARLRDNYESGSKMDAVKTLARVPLDQPLLQAGVEAAELARDPERSVTKSAARLASSFIPFGGALRDVAKLTDREEGRYASSQSFSQQVKQGIPGLRSSLPITERPHTRAERLARRFVREGMSGRAPQSDVETSSQLTTLRTRSRRGENVTPELLQLRGTGAISPEQAKNVKEARGRTRLGEDISTLSPDEALRVYSAMNPDEQRVSAASIKHKIANSKADAAKKRGFKERARELGLVQ